MGKVYDYIFGNMCWNSYDNYGHSLISIIDDTAPNVHNSAGWDQGTDIVLYGTVDAGFRPWAACLEGTAHEVGHGITLHSSHLVYSGESAALYESFSNITGIVIRHFTMNPPSVNWLFGQRFFISGQAYIDLANPHNGAADTQRPDFYHDPTDWYSGPENSTFAHVNSGVIDKMFYFLTMGGTSSHNGVVINGIGIQDAYDIQFLTNTHADYWSNATTSFVRARQHFLNAAYNLKGWYSAKEAARAWNAVGVCDNCTYVPGDANGNGMTNGIDAQYLIAYLKGLNPPAQTCDLLAYEHPINDFYVAADYDGNCIVNGVDVTYALEYFKGQLPDIKWCRHFTPESP